VEPVWQFLHCVLKRLKPRALSPPDELDELDELDEVLPEELLELDELLELEELVLPDDELLELEELAFPEDELLELVFPDELVEELDEELEAPFTGSPEQADSSAAATATRKNLSIIDSLRLIVQKTIWHKIQKEPRIKSILGRGLGVFVQAVKSFAFKALG
jgi:hypothetical protein